MYRQEHFEKSERYVSQYEARSGFLPYKEISTQRPLSSTDGTLWSTRLIDKPTFPRYIPRYDSSQVKDLSPPRYVDRWCHDGYRETLTKPQRGQSCVKDDADAKHVPLDPVSSVKEWPQRWYDGNELGGGRYCHQVPSGGLLITHSPILRYVGDDIGGDPHCFETPHSEMENKLSLLGAGRIRNSPDGFSIELDVEHLSVEEIKVTIGGNVLLVEAESVQSGKGRSGEDENLRRVFTRKYALPPDVENVEAKFIGEKLLRITGQRKQWKETEIDIHYEEKNAKRHQPNECSQSLHCQKIGALQPQTIRRDSTCTSGTSSSPRSPKGGRASKL